MAVCPPGSDEAEADAEPTGLALVLDGGWRLGENEVDWVANAVALKGSLSSSSRGMASKFVDDVEVPIFPPATVAMVVDGTVEDDGWTTGTLGFTNGRPLRIMVSSGSARATEVARAFGRVLWIAHRAWSSTVCALSVARDWRSSFPGTKNVSRRAHSVGGAMSFWMVLATACADCNFSAVSRNAVDVWDDDDDDEEEWEGRRSTERISSSTRRRPSPGFEARAAKR